MIKQKIIYGIHALSESLASHSDIDKIYMKKGAATGELLEIKRTARAQGIPVMEVPAERLNRFTRGAHQGVVALISPITYTRLESLRPRLYDEGQMPFIVLLDGVTDVRNFGAIARTCECAGVHAIVIPERDSVSVTADAVNASAGALMRIPVCRERDLVTACRFLRDSGLQLVGADVDATTNYTSLPMTPPLGIVMGSEQKGISTGVLKQLTDRVSIPQLGQISSLNVSVATGIMLYEVVRQHNASL